MSRKDTILVAVVINAGLLAILFATAIIYDPVVDSGSEFDLALVDGKNSSPDSSHLIAALTKSEDDDHVLKYYTSHQAQTNVSSNEDEINFSESAPIQIELLEVEDFVDLKESQSSEDEFIEIKVKQGDMLEKIARANKTTVGRIKRANGLTSEKLSIGQVLKIPVNQNKASSSTTHEQTRTALAEERKKESKTNDEEPVHYTIKSGDNPWKIARQFGVKYEEILRLNHMSEEKARNLKIGDRIRVK